MDEKRKPKLFILGASGFLGYNLALHLGRDFLVTGASYHHQVHLPDAQIFPIDPKKTELLEALVRVNAPDLVINAVGINDRRVIAESPKLADHFNTLTAVSLALLAAKMKAPFVQLSCATVYDGSDGGYSEDNMDFALHDDLGKQKLAAESYIRAQTMESNILRVGKVLGLGHTYRHSYFDSFRLKIAAKQNVEAARKYVRSYLSVRSFVNAVRLVLLSGAPGRHRTLNLGGPAMSEYELIHGWAELGGRGNLVKPMAEEGSRNHSIKSTNFAAAFPEWKEETKPELYLNLLKDLTPGVGVKKWQKTLQIP